MRDPDAMGRLEREAAAIRILNDLQSQVPRSFDTTLSSIAFTKGSGEAEFVRKWKELIAARADAGAGTQRNPSQPPHRQRAVLPARLVTAIVRRRSRESLTLTAALDWSRSTSTDLISSPSSEPTHGRSGTLVRYWRRRTRPCTSVVLRGRCPISTMT
jgi:hypothetical protein